MTGEMSWINPETGKDSNGDVWNIHLAIAKAVGGELKPYDVYQGPYISVGIDLRIGNSPYSIPVQNQKCVRLWVIPVNDYDAVVYREDTDKQSYAFCMYSGDVEFEAKHAALSLFVPSELGQEEESKPTITLNLNLGDK